MQPGAHRQMTQPLTPDMTGLHLTFGLFLLVLLGIGAYFYRTTDTRRLADYMLAGRDVGVWPIAISEVASVASGWTFFAWVGVGFTTGLHGLWFSLAMLLVVLFMYRYVGPPFRRTSQTLNSQTVVDHLALTFHSTATGTAIRWVSTIAVVVFMISYVGAQLIAVGEALDTALELPYVAAVLTGGIAVAVYTTLGGFSASVWTDVVQGVLVLIAALLLPVAAIASVGGWSAFLAEATAIDPTLLSGTGGMGGGALVLALLAWFTFAMGAIGQPHALMRFQAIRSDTLISKAAVIALSFQALRLTVPLFIGIAGRVLYGEGAEPESAAMLMLADLFPPWLAGVLLAGIIGAILSTSDSMMIVASADLTKLYRTQLRAHVSEGTLLRLGRLIVGVVAALGIGLALWRPGTIFDIIEFAFVGLGVTVGLPLAALMIWPRTTGPAVLATVAIGLIGTIGNLYLFPDLFPILVWPLALAVLIGTSLLTRKPQARAA